VHDEVIFLLISFELTVSSAEDNSPRTEVVLSVVLRGSLIESDRWVATL